MTALAEVPVVGDVKRLRQQQERELYARALFGLARKGGVPGIALSHLASRVLLFLLGQRPGYFGHQKVIASAVESNLTSVRAALFELRDAGLVSWQLVPPHHPLPTGKHTRTNVNVYVVEVDALLHALEGDRATPSRTVASMHPNSGASSGRDLKFEQDPPLTPRGETGTSCDEERIEREVGFTKSEQGEPEVGERKSAVNPRRARQPRPSTPPPELETVLTAWLGLDLGAPDDRSVRALQNRSAEGAAVEELEAAVEGARHDDWLRHGRAKSAFAVVFASRASVERFANAGKEHARQLNEANRRRAAERRAERERFAKANALSREETAAVAREAMLTLEAAVAAQERQRRALAPNAATAPAEDALVSRKRRPLPAPAGPRGRSQFAPVLLANPLRSLLQECEAPGAEPNPPAIRP